MPLTIYLAGPDVFLPNAEEVGRIKQAMCDEFGFKGLFPLDNDKTTKGDPALIFELNRKRMDAAALGCFNLTPFRGPSADVGTVFELGYMYARNKPVFGYTGSDTKYRERVGVDAHEGLRDRTGFSIEPFGLADNLVIVRSIVGAGGFIEQAQETTDSPLDALPAFTAFRACLHKLQQRAARGEFDRRKDPDKGRATWAGTR